MTDFSPKQLSALQKRIAELEQEVRDYRLAANAEADRADDLARSLDNATMLISAMVAAHPMHVHPGWFDRARGFRVTDNVDGSKTIAWVEG